MNKEELLKQMKEQIINNVKDTTDIIKLVKNHPVACPNIYGIDVDDFDCCGNCTECYKNVLEKIEKQNNKLSKFKVGDKYKVTDRLSGDTYEAEVIAIDREMVMKRKSGAFTIVKESMIGTTLEFIAICETVQEKDVPHKMPSCEKIMESYKKEPTKEECEKKTEDFAEELLNIIRRRPFDYYFKTYANPNNISRNRYL